jgi:hypothetical protein
MMIGLAAAIDGAVECSLATTQLLLRLLSRHPPSAGTVIVSSGAPAAQSVGYLPVPCRSIIHSGSGLRVRVLDYAQTATHL